VKSDNFIEIDNRIHLTMGAFIYCNKEKK
jgi:hypothetical protein